MVNTPFSTVTFTSSFLISGNSALMRYSFSSSVMSASGVHPKLSRSTGSRLHSHKRREHKSLDNGGIERICKRMTKIERKREAAPLRRQSNNGANERKAPRDDRPAEFQYCLRAWLLGES